MLPTQTKPHIEARVGLASPLGVAISESDRQTIAMVENALRTKAMGLAYQPVVLSRAKLNSCTSNEAGSRIGIGSHSQ